jgi:hypothetical protein
MPNLSARPLTAQALSDLLDRKPHLLRPLAAQLLPPPAAIDPAERLGIDFASLRTAEDCRRMLGTVLEAAARGEIAPGDGARIAKRVRAWLRAFVRLALLSAADRHTGREDEQTADEDLKRRRQRRRVHVAVADP